MPLPQSPAALHCSVLSATNYPMLTTRITVEQGDFADLDAVLAALREKNPDLGLPGLLQAIVREGVQAVRKQVKADKISPFLLNRRV
jgi:hypothetical protein